jgi:hypothetical protein
LLFCHYKTKTFAFFFEFLVKTPRTIVKSFEQSKMIFHL